MHCREESRQPPLKAAVATTTAKCPYNSADSATARRVGPDATSMMSAPARSGPARVRRAGLLGSFRLAGEGAKPGVVGTAAELTESDRPGFGWRTERVLLVLVIAGRS